MTQPLTPDFLALFNLTVLIGIRRSRLSSGEVVQVGWSVPSYVIGWRQRSTIIPLPMSRSAVNGDGKMGNRFLIVCFPNAFPFQNILDINIFLL